MVTESGKLKIIIALSLIALCLSAYLLYIKLTGTKSFCDFSAEISCDTVAESPYAEFPANSGIPVSGLGMLAYLAFLVPAYLLLKNWKFTAIHSYLTREHVFMLLKLWAVFSILFYLYLTYLELFVIYALCPTCIVTFILMLGIFVVLLIPAAPKNRRKA